MLILARKRDESIMIGDNIEVKIMSVTDGVVKIGIDAPRETDVHRHEIYARVQEEKGFQAKNGSLSNGNRHGNLPLSKRV